MKERKPWEEVSLPQMLDKNRMLYRGKELTVHSYPVYLPQGEEKKFPVYPGSLYCCLDTDLQWVKAEGLCHIRLKEDRDFLDVLDPGQELPWIRYQATDDPEEEDPTRQRFVIQRQGKGMDILRIGCYCERLHIPARIEGFPVETAYIPKSLLTENLRELVVEEGVKKLYFDFHRSHLALLDIPESVELIQPPNGICETPWFAAQPSGPVYFHRYYCGTRETQKGTLTLAPDTVGIVEKADRGQHWRRVEFPETVHYIGDGAFSQCRFLREKRFAEPKSRMADAFFPGLPWHRVYDDPQEDTCWNTQEIPDLLTGWDLYQLGRVGKAARVLIPRGMEPLAPRLHYDNGWLAEYFYCSEQAEEVGHRLVLRLPEGIPVEFDSYTYPSVSQGFWSREHIPAFYHCAESYLNRCAHFIAVGHPSSITVKELEGEWNYLLPDAFKRWLNGNAYYPEKCQTKTYLPDERWQNFWSWKQVKQTLLNRYCTTQEEVLAAPLMPIPTEPAPMPEELLLEEVECWEEEEGLTWESLYDMGRNSPMVRGCVPPGLIQSLPKLRYLHGYLVAEFWYYHTDREQGLDPEPKFYAALHVHTDEIISLRALTEERIYPQSTLQAYLPNLYSSREVQYLEFCANMINNGSDTEETLIHAQALWLDAQCREAFPWLYQHSGVAPEAVAQLLTREEENTSRHLLILWFLMQVTLRSKGTITQSRMAGAQLSRAIQTDRKLLIWLYEKIPGFGLRLEDY